MANHADGTKATRTITHTGILGRKAITRNS
jgi:hypothetical protein